MGKVTWRGVTVDATTAKALDEAARIVGNDIRLTPIPGCGSYQTNTTASAGTHAGGGAIDIDTSYLTADQATRVETAMRRVGFAAWHRTRIVRVWQDHVHALRMDCSDLSSPARTQVQDYLAGYSGIPIGGRTSKDTGTRAYVNVRWGTYSATAYSPLPTALTTGGLSMSDVTDILAKLDDVLKAIQAIPERVGYEQIGTTGKSLDTYTLGTNNNLGALATKVDANQADVLAKLADLATAVAALPKA